MSTSNSLSSAKPVGLGAQSDLIGAPEPMSTEAVLGAPIGGSWRVNVLDSVAVRGEPVVTRMRFIALPVMAASRLAHGGELG